MPTHVERRRLKYSATQLFDLVADVDRYPEFMPWVVASHIDVRRDGTFLVDMTVGAGPLRKRFSTTGVLHRPHRIRITSHDPLFAKYEQRWTFETASEGETNVECYVDCRLRSRLLDMLMTAVFDDRAAATMAAYMQRARRLYGTRSWSGSDSD